MGEAAKKLTFTQNQQLNFRPVYSLQDIYGEEIIFNPKLYAEDYQHFAGDLLSLNALTGRELSVVGNTPVVCHEACATKPALQLLKKAGLQLPSKLYTYRNEEEYIETLKLLSKQQKKVIFQYPHPEDKVSTELYRVGPEVLAYLCDKRNIPELVPSEHIPKRRMMSLEQILEEKPQLPFVLKTGDGRPTSGGYGVLLINDEKQLEDINESFGDLTSIIVEEQIPYEQNISVHYMADKNGVIQFLGKSEQLVTEDGNFCGSWISTDYDDSIADIVKTGFEVMKNISDKGYVGVAGFDVLLYNGQYYFIDLNVRFNASTCGLLLYNEIQERFGKKCMRLCNFDWNENFESAIPIAEKFLDKEHFIPLSVLDPRYFPDNNQVTKIIGLVIGHSAEEVEEVLEEMNRAGFNLKE
ncbi:ATP-grasp domain-containing protein [Metabacillus halosaccharovorans]|uniref:ATP-grasp domain-containing protein n=1 Tax=Metabacillus halosaccharovorans TaxID=930124 RepID=UPI000995A5D2|nr:ATP-grasp domain-containing protein [Metabacillus halosaccharovorans]